MRLIRATLIQPLTEFWGAIEEYLMPLMHRQSVHYPIHIPDVLRYIIAEELELVHLLFDVDHQGVRNHEPYASLYAQLRSALPVELSVLFRQFIVAPQIYAGELQVTVRIRGFDLYLYYWYSQATAPIIAHTPITSHEPVPSHPRVDPRRSGGG